MRKAYIEQLDKKYGETELARNLRKRWEKNLNQAKNLFKQLINGGKSVFYATDKINKTL